jgi:CBS domain containing-hemolysin-like protein
VVKRAPETMRLQTFFEANRDLRFSRVPLHLPDAHDHVTGYFLKHELFSRVAKGEGDAPLSLIKRPIMVIAEDFPIPDLFNRFLQQREHIALVVDEFGGMSGIVTMEDVIETLLGLEIVDELDHVEDMQTLARKNWELRARATGLIQELPQPPATAADESERP